MMLRTWFQSQIDRQVQLLVEVETEKRAADGMPLQKPNLLGFLRTANGFVVDACVYSPKPQRLQLPESTTLWKAKQAIEKACAE